MSELRHTSECAQSRVWSVVGLPRGLRGRKTGKDLAGVVEMEAEEVKISSCETQNLVCSADRYTRRVCISC